MSYLRWIHNKAAAVNYMLPLLREKCRGCEHLLSFCASRPRVLVYGGAMPRVCECLPELLSSESQSSLQVAALRVFSRITCLLVHISCSFRTFLRSVFSSLGWGLRGLGFSPGLPLFFNLRGGLFDFCAFLLKSAERASLGSPQFPLEFARWAHSSPTLENAEKRSSSSLWESYRSTKYLKEATEWM